MANKLTYIASGCSYMRILFEEAYSDPEVKAWIVNAFKWMQHNPNHSFGLLYNAWTEKYFGEIFSTHYKDGLDIIQADSGGLQIVTQGLSITDEMKDQVYANQSKYSDMAMSFDEIPVSFSGKSSSRLDLSNRWFDTQRFEDCARLTGKNVFKQIQKFVDEKSNSRPVFIAQGNCYDTFMQWTEYALMEIPKEYHQYVGSVAISGAAHGFGLIQDIQRAFIYTQLPIETQHKHLHLLGVGSLNRLIPNLIFIKNGLYDGVHMSIDSTTHTSGAHMGRYYFDTNYEFPRHLDRIVWSAIYEDIMSKFDLGMSLETFHEAMNSKTVPYKEKYGSRNNVIKAFVGLTLSMIDNFKTSIDKSLQSEKNILKLTNRKNRLIYESVFKITNYDEYRYWENNIGRFIMNQGNAIKSQSTATLDEFLL